MAIKRKRQERFIRSCLFGLRVFLEQTGYHNSAENGADDGTKFTDNAQNQAGGFTGVLEFLNPQNNTDDGHDVTKQGKQPSKDNADNT